MDRTLEYKEYIKNHSKSSIHCSFFAQDSCSERFLDTILKNLQNVSKVLKDAKHYNQYVYLEQELNSMSKESLDILSSIEIQSNEDEIKHFEGIRNIINMKIVALALEIQSRKKNLILSSVSLEPEKPVIYSKKENIFLEEENQKLINRFDLDSSEIISAKKKLLEIEKIQDLINLNLLKQDERIDTIIFTSKSSKTNLNKSSAYFKKANSTGRFMRRVLFIFLLSISFVLVISHFFHR